MDHPGFVVEQVEGRTVAARFRGGTMPQYFDGARVEFFDDSNRRSTATVSTYRADEKLAELSIGRSGAMPEIGAIGRWRFSPRSVGISNGVLRAPACDDLAGVAASLAALDRVRRASASPDFRVLLTRAEELGFVGAIGACRHGTIPESAQVLSIETSRSFADSPIGGGPIVRVGDATSIFDHQLTDAVVRLASASNIPHQRRLMAGGSCEATAFCAFGYRATGLCLALGNYHNMVDIEGVAAGRADARVAPETISLADFDGLVRLIAAVATGLGTDAVESAARDLRSRLTTRFEKSSPLL